MRRLSLGVWLSFAVLVGTPVVAAATTISLDFSSVTGAKVSFANGNFTFVDSPAGNDFQVTLADASLFGLYGNIDGTFSIGAITTTGLVSRAPVSGTGQFKIYDGVSGTFSANLGWVDIYQLGTSGAVNTVGAVNLSDFAYTGSNPGLLALLHNGEGSVTATFQFIPKKSLATLKTATAAKPLTTSYSGSVESISVESDPVPDGGATITLLGLALAGLSIVKQRTDSR